MKKILIVDDATFMQRATSAMLAPKYETVCASSGEEALELYEKEKPDMILSDLLMPGMTGFELLGQLQERYLEQIPVMFMTADESDENESIGLEYGAMDYIRKPFKQELLLRRVDNIMRYMDRIAGLKRVAETDPMTGLLNKANVTRTLEELCGHAAGTLMMVDLDSFKLVNDLFGHAMGDRILIRFAEILKGAIRATDVAGRIGGDEFIVFCKDITEESIIAEKSRQINLSIQESAKSFMGDNHGIPLGASIGAVPVPAEGTVFSELSEKADKALYRVKQNGKHGYEVYRSDIEVPGEDEEAEETGSIRSVHMILEERNRQKGAYALGSDGFQSVYRYAVRSMEKYHHTLGLALFTLRPTGTGPEQAAADCFGELLGMSLRRSDAYTKHGSLQYIALLAEADTGNRSAILSRILDNWSHTRESEILTVSCETMILEA